MASKTAGDLTESDPTLQERMRPYAVRKETQAGAQPGSKGMGKGRGRIRGKGRRLVKKG